MNAAKVPPPSVSALELSGQVALITGGASGIGLGIAQSLAERGCKIVIASRDRDRVATAAASLPGSLGIAPCDVRDAAAIEQLFSAAIEQFGQVDIAIACAGIARSGVSSRHVPSPVYALDEADWDDIVETNLRGTFLTARAAARHMVPRRCGQIVNISSARAGRRGMAYGAGYCASKMAAVAMFEALAEELRTQGIRAWSFFPDVVETGMLAGTDLAKQGALTPRQVGDFIADLLALPIELQIDSPAMQPLGVRKGKRRAEKNDSEERPA